MIIKIFTKMDIPFSLQGIRRGPLSESDCSSVGLSLLWSSHGPFVEYLLLENLCLFYVQLFY